MTPQLHYELAFAEYQSLPGWNPSRVKIALLDSPLALKWAMDHEPLADESETPAMRLGTAAHARILQPAEFAGWYEIWRGGRRQGKAWEEFRDQAEAEGKTVISLDEHETIADMAEACERHEWANRLLLAPGDAELSMTWQDEVTGLPCKGRADLVSHDGVLVDLKTAADPSPRAFVATGTRLGYHISLAAYRIGLRACGVDIRAVYIVAVQNRPPFDAVVYEIPPATLRQGERDWRRGLDLVHRCLDTGEWPGCGGSMPVQYELPEWAVDDVLAVE